MPDWFGSETTIPPADIALRLGIAALFGMVVGLERELRNKPAGLRTHMLVALGAAVTTIVALELLFSLHDVIPDVRADPIRVIEGVMGGIGFLGAGAIIRAGEGVHNLTTAATIWVSGAIGLACGGGYYVLAAIGFAFVFTVVAVLRFVEHFFLRGRDTG